ncbi:MAG: hypothetical protein P4L10_07035 [Acidobacteriaceae bacterium]|nr:hypothetical protein [Acidobacteriaceae bacterium]
MEAAESKETGADLQPEDAGQQPYAAEEQQQPAPAEGQPAQENYDFLAKQGSPDSEEVNKQMAVDDLASGSPPEPQNVVGESEPGQQPAAEAPAAEVSSPPEAENVEQEPPKEAQQMPASEFQATFDEINGDIDDLDSTLSSSIASYPKAKESVGSDLIRLCTHYVFGNAGSPQKGQEPAFGSSKVSPIKKTGETGSPSPQYMDQPDVGRDYGEDANDIARGLEEDQVREEDSQRYKPAMLTKNFYQRDQKLSYKKYEEPAATGSGSGYLSKYPTYSAEPQRSQYSASGSAKQTSGLPERHYYKF